MTINEEFKESISLINEEYLLDENIKKKFNNIDLTLYERAKLALEFEEHIKIKFKGIKSIAIDKELAKIGGAGMGHGTIHKVRVIEKEATIMQIGELTNGTKAVSAIYEEIRHPESTDVKLETLEVKKCKVCGVTKPVSGFWKKFNTCNTCRGLLFDVSTDTKITREKLKRFANVDVQAIYDKMKQPTAKEENNDEIKNEYILKFNELLNKFDTDINQYIHMNFVFKNDKSSSRLTEKTISNLKKILKMMGV